jgi:hypothetical protein
MYSFLTLTLHKSEWSASGPGRSTPREKTIEMNDVEVSESFWMLKKYLSLISGFEIRIVQPSAACSLVTAVFWPPFVNSLHFVTVTTWRCFEFKIQNINYAN